MTIKQSKFSKISNTIFLFITIILLTFLWTIYYSNNIKLGIIFSLIFAICFAFVYFPFKSIINKKRNISKEILLKKEHTLLQLEYGKSTDIINFITNLYQIKEYKTISDSHILELNTNTEYYFLFSEINNEMIHNIYKKRLTSNIKVFTLNNTNFPQLENINLEIITFDKIFDKIQKNNTELNFNINNKKSTKISFKDIFCEIFNKQKSKSYLNLGLLVLISSLFTIYNTYYVIISSILFLFAIYSRFNTRFNNYNK